MITMVAMVTTTDMLMTNITSMISVTMTIIMGEATMKTGRKSTWY